MPELPFDVAVANRFISSLSKSLQALCHGCMDFDSGIEIVGYINVNIDCGSKTDYVLNEKVLKSTTNSMTFVSNSFLAKKDQPKQMRDGACSPIPQFASHVPAVSPYQHRMRGFSHSSFSRSGHRGANYYRGAQKRGFSGEWHGGSKRQRPMPGSVGLSEQYSSPMSAPGSSNQTFGGSSFTQQNQNLQQIEANPNAALDTENALRNIKTEALEGSGETQPSPESSGQQANNNGSSENASGVNIKSDPDAISTTDDGEGGANTKSEMSDNQGGDFKGTFLQPPSADNQDSSAPATDGGDQTSLNDQPVGFETPFPNPDTLSTTGDNTASGDANVNTSDSGNVAMESGGGDCDYEGGGASNDAPVEYDNAAEDASYSEYPDAGEGSSSGQFEVIEIDDEDEDMQAMFGASHHTNPPTNRPMGAAAEYSPYRHTTTFQTSPPETEFSVYPTVMRTAGGSCSPEKYAKMQPKPHGCEVCGKRFLSTTGLKHHRQVHSTERFHCPICDFKFMHKHHMKDHVRRRHNLIVCTIGECRETFNPHEQRRYSDHLSECKHKSRGKF